MMYRTNLNRTLSLTYVSVSFFFSYMMPPLLLPVFVVHVLNTCAISYYQHFALRLLLPHPLIRFLCFSPPFRSPEETAVNGGHSELFFCGVRAALQPRLCKRFAERRVLLVSEAQSWLLPCILQIEIDSTMHRAK